MKSADRDQEIAGKEKSDLPLSLRGGGCCGGDNVSPTLTVKGEKKKEKDLKTFARGGRRILANGEGRSLTNWGGNYKMYWNTQRKEKGKRIDE